MIDERGNFRELILKPSMVDRVSGARPLSGRISRTPLQRTHAENHRRRHASEASSTMRKAFAINYVTHDGVMQSPGAFQ